MADSLPAPSVVPPATLQDRRASGVALRKIVRRMDQGIWTPAPGRPDPVRALIAANAARLPELLPIKWARMAASPFGFFRGAASLMAADLAGRPVTGLTVQLSGDAHVLNLGAYAAPDGHLVFDINDFDETVAGGPWEWDVKRLAASLILANRQAGGKDAAGGDAVRAFVGSYRESVSRFAAMRTMELMAYEVHRHSKDAAVRAILQKAERATPARTLAKLTEPGADGEPRFHDQPPLLHHIPADVAAEVVAALRPYRDTLGVDRQHAFDAYRPVDVTFKVVGTGSIGTRDYIVLLIGCTPDDVLFLQVKEELPSVCAAYLNVPAAPHQGRRVAEGQHRCQTVTDPLVGWTTIRDVQYLVRQLSDHKAGIDPADLKGDVLVEYALVCGETLAKAHARTGDAAALAGYCGGADRLDRAMVDFAIAYANQTARDHAAWLAAIQSGQVKAASGV